MSGGDDFASPAAVAVQPLEHLELQNRVECQGAAGTSLVPPKRSQKALNPKPQKLGKLQE